MYDMLFSPMDIGTMTVKNRIVMTAAEFSLGEPSGKVLRDFPIIMRKGQKGE